MIRQAGSDDLSAVKTIVDTTISAVYPRYYPQGAVAFFLAHHSEHSIRKDIDEACVWVYCDDAGQITGTVTRKGSEILRLFVLPEFQGNGYGKALLDFAEQEVLRQYPEILIDASLPAKSLYLRRGYQECGYHILPVGEDFLCYDRMIKRLPAQQ